MPVGVGRLLAHKAHEGAVCAGLNGRQHAGRWGGSQVVQPLHHRRQGLGVGPGLGGASQLGIQPLGHGGHGGQQLMAPVGQFHGLAVALQLQTGLAATGGGQMLVVGHVGNFLRTVGRAVGQQAVHQEHVEKVQGLGVDADGLERVEVEQAHFHVLHTALAQRMQRALAGEDGALGADGAVELVFDLQQSGGQLQVIAAGVAHAVGIVGGPGPGEGIVQRVGVAVQPVVAHAQRGLGIALVAQLAHAQRGAVRHVQRAPGQHLQFVLAPLDKGAAHRRRGTQQHQQQKGVAAEVADQCEVLGTAHTGQRPVVVDAGDGLHAPPVAQPQAHAVHAFGPAHVGAAIAAQRNGFVGGQAAGHARHPQHFVALGSQGAQGELVDAGEFVQTARHSGMHASDQFQLAFAVIGGDVGMGQGRSQACRVGGEGQQAIGAGTQAFFLDATAHAREALRRKGLQALWRNGEIAGRLAHDFNNCKNNMS